MELEATWAKSQSHGVHTSLSLYQAAWGTAELEIPSGAQPPYVTSAY